MQKTKGCVRCPCDKPDKLPIRHDVSVLSCVGVSVFETVLIGAICMAYLYLYVPGQNLSAEAPRQLWRMVLNKMREKMRRHFDSERDIRVHG